MFSESTILFEFSTHIRSRNAAFDNAGRNKKSLPFGRLHELSLDFFLRHFEYGSTLPWQYKGRIAMAPAIGITVTGVFMDSPD